MMKRKVKEVKLISGEKLKKWTNSKNKDQHLYFTSPSVTNDNKYLIIISERDTHPNLYAINRNDESVFKISHSEGLLKSYTYPMGSNKGLSKVSPFLDARKNILYWIQNDSIWKFALDKDTLPGKLSNLPKGWITGYTHVSDDGSCLCVPCTDPRAFIDEEDKTQHDQLKNVPLRMLKMNLKTKLVLVKIESGESFIHAEIPFWVTHVQFIKGSNRSFIVNCEGGFGNTAKRTYPYWGRIWKISEDGNYQRLFNQPEGEYVNHENIIEKNGEIIFHGRNRITKLKKMILYGMIITKRLLPRCFKKSTLENISRHFVEIRNKEGEKVLRHEVNHPVSHAISGTRKHQFIADSRDGYIYFYSRTNNEYIKQVICSHGSSMMDQDSHPHPRPTADGKSIIFTSDVGGACNVYEIELKQPV